MITTYLNVIGLRRAGFDSAVRGEIKEAFDLYYRSGLSFRQAEEAARERSWGEVVERFWTFVGSPGKKGICPFRRGRDRSGE